MRTFFFGAATASHQVEGGTRNDWSEWEKKNAARLAATARQSPPAGGWPSYILQRYPNPLQEKNYISGEACDSYHRFREDFDIAKSLGHTAHRFSIEWSRIEPEEGIFDGAEIAHYRAVVRALRERGIEPFITLWHWTLPVWLAKKGGVLNPEFPEYFREYAQKVVEALGEDVTFWITINEPEINSSNAYLKRRWPPQERNLLLHWRSMRNRVRAHLAVYKAMKKISPRAEVGLSVNQIYFESAGGLVNDFLARCADYFWNFYFLNRVASCFDFIGVNYYFHNRVRYGFNKNENKMVSDMEWEIYPEGLYRVLINLKKYGRPIYVTENGIADARDAVRERFIKEHLQWMRKAMDEGADVRGYFHWSLLDNFEWDNGFWPRFGLVEVDYRTLARKIRPSAFAYKRFIKEWVKT